jgi:hypothetical protein
VGREGRGLEEAGKREAGAVGKEELARERERGARESVTRIRGVMGRKQRHYRSWSERCSRQQTGSGWRGCCSTAWRHSGKG